MFCKFEVQQVCQFFVRKFPLLFLFNLKFYSMYAFRDVTYFPSSGSIIAVSGYSSNNFNVVIWDTLAPAPTSRASILCHEGFAQIFLLLNSNVC